MSFTEPTNSPTPHINYDDQSFYFYVLMFFIFLFCLCQKNCLRRFQRTFRFRRNRVYYDIENARYNFSNRLIIPTTEINNVICCICLDDLSNNQNVVLIDICLHPYHKDCINEWLNLNPICPICRRNLLN